MNVWIVNQYAIPPKQAGITRHFMLAQELIKRGNSVRIIASSFDHVSRSETRLTEGELFRHEVIDGVSFTWLRTPPYPGNTVARMWNMLVFACRVWARVGLDQLENPDVIVGSSPTLFAAAAAHKLARHYRVPFVLEIRDLWPDTLVELGNVSPQHPVTYALEKLERYLYTRADRIVSLLPGAVDRLEQKGAARCKVAWIPNGVDMEQVPEPVPPMGSDVFTVMYAGAHGMANGLDAVLDAAVILQRTGWGTRVRFRLIGDGPEKPRLRDRCISENITNVQFEDAVPKHLVYSVMREADAFLMLLKDSPLFRWGVSPNKLYDYFANARPVVFAVTTPYDPVKAIDAGISVPPGDPAGLAEAVRTLARLTDKERWAMGLRGFEYVRTEYSVGHLVDKLEKLLAEVTS